MKAKLCFSFALMFGLTSFVSLDDFCAAFQQNSNRINFVIRDVYELHDRHPDPNNAYPFKYYIFIGGKYWTATYTDPPVGGKPTLKLDAKKSESSQLFTERFSFVVWMRIKESVEYFPFMFEKTNWTQLEVGTTGKQPLSNITKQYSGVIRGVKEKPLTALSENEDWIGVGKKDRLVVISQPNGEQTPYSIKRYDLEMDPKGNVLHINATENLNTNNLVALKSLKNYHLASVTAQWTTHDNQYSHLYIFQTSLGLKWCVSIAEKPIDSKCQTNPSDLIYCEPKTEDEEDNKEDNKEDTHTTTESPEEEDNRALIIILIILAFVVTILLIAIIWLCCCRQQRTGEEAQPMSSIDRKDTNRSGIQAAPGSQVANSGSKKVSQTGSPAVASSSGQNK